MVFTTKDLEKISCAKTQSHKEIYKMLLQDIYKKLKIAAQNNKKNLIYTFRAVIPGYPIYNMQNACAYSLKKLKKGGFFVHPDFLNCTLCIQWN